MSSGKLKPPRPLHISDLPVEMLEYSISFLPLVDRKSVSLVSKLWCQLAFSFSAMDYVKLRINPIDCKFKKADLAVLRKSMRRYRHLELFSSPPLEHGLDDATVMNILIILGPNIESLYLIHCGNPKQLQDFVSRMPNVKQISLTIWVIYKEGHPNAQQTVDILKLYEAQLTHFELSSTHNDRLPIDQLNLCQLHTLKLWRGNCVHNEDLLCRLFKNLPVLRTAFMGFNVTPKVLKVICDNCSHLSKLTCQTDELSGELFCYFKQLENLRALLVDGYIRRGLLYDCKPLKSVDFFAISRHPEASMEELSRVFPNLRTLQVKRSSRMPIENTTVHEIYHNFNQVKRLIIDDETVDNYSVDSAVRDSPKISKLSGIINLQELTLCCMDSYMETLEGDPGCLFRLFLRESPHFTNRVQCNLKRLKIKGCRWVMRDSLVHAVKQFPRLLYLEVSECRTVTSEDMAFARKLIPKCAMHFVRYEDELTPPTPRNAPTISAGSSTPISANTPSTAAFSCWTSWVKLPRSSPI